MNIKKLEQKDRYGNMFSIEFDNTVPEMSMIPDHPGMPIGTDTVPAWLTPGEFVVNAEATRMFGPQIEQMNNVGRVMQAEQGGTIPEYAAEGTMVGPVSRPKYGAAKSIYDKLIDEGLNHNAAVGIIANFQIESGLQPSVKQLNGKYANKYDDDGSLNKFFRTRPDDSYFKDQGFGLAQWTKGRRKALEKFAKDNELPLNSADTQINFMMKELDGEYKNVKNKLASVQSPEEATEIFLKDYEKAGKPVEDRRLAYAQELNNFITDDVTTAPILNPSEVPADEITTAPIPKPEIPVRIKDIDPYPTTFMEGIQKIMGIGTKFKAEGGTINDPEADILNAYKEFAQQQTEDNGMFIGSEEVDEGGEYDGAAHLEEIDLMNQMQKERASNAMTMAPDEAIDTMGDIPELLAPPMTPTDTSGRESYRPGTVPLDTTSNDLTTEQPDLSSMFGGIYTPEPKTMELDEAIDTMPNTTIDASGRRNYRPGTVPPPDVEVPDLSSMFGGIYAPDSKRSNDLATEQQALKDKAQAEVDKAGQVSDETAAKVEKNIAERGFISQAEKAQANREEMQKNMAAKNAERMEERAYEEYLKQSQRANAAGVEGFPSYEEWKVTQGLPEAPIKEDPPEKVAKQSEVLNKLADNIKSMDDETPVVLSEGDATGAVDNSNDPEVKTKLEQAGAFLSGMFGDLFDRQELARMAVLYTGSMLLGNSHGGSLNYAAKNYLTRVDAKAANHTANVKKLMEDAEYTPASIQKYSETKDISVLTKKAAAVNPTGTKEMWYTPQGKRVQAEKFKVGDSYIWSADGGKTSIPAAWHQDAARTPGTDKYNDRIKSERGIITDTIKELQEPTGDVVPGDSKSGRKRTQKTGITPTVAANEAAVWAAKNGIDVAQMGVYTKQAYQMAVQDATDNKDVKPTSLLPYLNQLKLRQDTGITELFDVPTKKGPAKPMDAVKIEELSLQFIKRAGGEGDLNTGRNRDAVNQFWTAAAEIWNEKTAANPDLIKQYQRKAAPGETAFYAYAKEQLNLPM